MRRADKFKFDPFTESTVDGIIAGTVSVRVCVYCVIQWTQSFDSWMQIRENLRQKEKMRRGVTRDVLMSGKADVACNQNPPALVTSVRPVSVYV